MRCGFPKSRSSKFLHFHCFLILKYLTSVCLSVYLSNCPSVYLSICLSIREAKKELLDLNQKWNQIKTCYLFDRWNKQIRVWNKEEGSYNSVKKWRKTEKKFLIYYKSVDKPNGLEFDEWRISKNWINCIFAL